MTNNFVKILQYIQDGIVLKDAIFFTLFISYTVLKYLDQVFLSVLAHFGSPETNVSNSAQEGFILCKEYSLQRMNEYRVDSHSLCFLLDAVMFFMYLTLHHMS